MTLAMTQPAPEFADADVLSLEVDLAEVTAEAPALRLAEVREGAMPAPAFGATCLALLRQAAQVLRADVAADEMLRALFNDIREPLGVDAYFRFMVNEAGDALALASCAGVSDGEARSFERVELGQAVCGNVALKRAPVVMSGIQASSDGRVQIVKNLGIRAVACNPLLAGERLFGTLSFASRTRDQFGAEEVAFFGAIARAVALSQERTRLACELAGVERELESIGRAADAAAVATSVPLAPLLATTVVAESAAPILSGAASAALLEAAPDADIADAPLSTADVSETVEVSALASEATRAAAEVAPEVDDEAPTVEVKALAIQELEAERAPMDEGEDITFTYMPPK